MKLGIYLLKTQEENRAKPLILLNVSDVYFYSYRNKDARPRRCCGYNYMLKTCLDKESTFLFW
jgi:hypothetical protein